jgi:hypothetical protein
MKKYSIIIIFALLVGLLGFPFLRQSKATPSPEMHGQVEGVSSNDMQGAVQALVVENEGVDEPMKKEEKLKQASTETLWEKGNFPERLQVADLDMPLLFEGAIDEELKQVILADIHLIYSEGVTYDRYEWRGRADNPTFDFAGSNYTSSETINLKASQVPNIVHEKLSRIIQVNGIDNIVVPKELISAYEKAWEKRKASPEKYESLEIFIDWINTASMEELSAKNPVWLYGYDGISDAHPEKAAELKESFLPKNIRDEPFLRHPSILEFTYVDQAVLEKRGAVEELPKGVTVADGKYIDEEGIPKGQALFLYDGKSWHIAFAPAGT